MANVTDKFNKLKQAIVGTKTSNIDNKLDDTIKDISIYKSQSGSNGYIELVRNVISKAGMSGGNMLGGNNNLFSNQDTSPSSFGQGKRLQRYRTYESIVGNISYCKRALDVLVGNILSPDDINKMSLEIKSESYLEDQTRDVKRVSKIQTINRRLKIDENLNNIVRNTLEYGDYFCEIADAKTALTSKSILSENDFFSGLLEDSSSTKETVYNENDIRVTLSYSSFSESKNSEKKDNGNNKDDEQSKDINLNNLNLVFHEPKRVVKLQSELFPLCFGYLIFPKQEFMNLYGNPQEQAVNDICTNILKSLKSKLPQAEEFNNDEELKDIISAMIKESGGSQIMNIRYVPPDRMVHFMVPSTKYYPYGESIFESCQFDAKILVSLTTALAIQRLSRSTEKRKIGVEIGLPKDASRQVQNLKEEFRKRKISLDSFGTVDTIPSTISTFEDIYIPQKDGKPYVDIETMDQGNVDIRSKVDELQFLRGSVVASLGVPNAFLNLEEELCLFSGTYIPMLDGGSLTLDKIIEEYQNGNYNMWTYSYDHETGKIAPGRIVWANYTRLQTQLVRVHLDNGEYVDCTPDHPFMLRDGSYKEAQYLQSDESLMPFILEEESNDHKNAVKIEWLEGKYDTCDITVEGFHNFPVKAGVMVHNSNKCLDLSSKIPLTDGTKPRLIDLINEYELNGELKDRYVYSYDNETGRIVPGKISWAGRTRMNTEVVRVTFDNGETQIATPDHKFMLRDGSYKEAQYLQEGESLMPFYSKLSHIKTTIKKVPYLSIYHPGLDTWELAHRSFAKHLGIVNDGDGLNVHHEDFNPLNNNPSNLQGLTDSDHVKIHIDHKHFLTTGRGKVKIENYVIENCSVCGEEYVRHIGNNQITCLKEECKKERSRLDGYKSWEKRKHNYSGSITLNCPYCGKSFTRRKKYIEQLSSGIATCGDKECKRQSTKDNVNDPSMKKVLSEAGKKGGNKSKEKLVEYNREHGAPMKGRTKQTHPETFEKRINSLKNNNPENSIIKNNHKVSKVELLSERYDTGDITVDVYHNFAINGGVIVSNSVLSEENVLFARTIVNHQKYLNPQIVDLFEKILNLHDPEEGLLALQTTDISLPSPRSLQYERESRYIGEIVTLIENLERIGIPKEYAKKKYLPQIDWNEVENWESHENIEKNISSDEEEEEDEFGGGGTF